jgi:hypothetical protein
MLKIAKRGMPWGIPGAIVVCWKKTGRKCFKETNSQGTKAWQCCDVKYKLISTIVPL